MDTEKPLSELLARISQSENENLMLALTADLNAFLIGLALLSGRKEANTQDFRLLLRRFALTLEAIAPSEHSPQTYAPNRAGRNGLHAIENEFKGIE